MGRKGWISYNDGIGVRGWYIDKLSDGLDGIGKKLDYKFVMLLLELKGF
jgi:hypothetical protein